MQGEFCHPDLADMPNPGGKIRLAWPIRSAVTFSLRPETAPPSVSLGKCTPGGRNSLSFTQMTWTTWYFYNVERQSKSCAAQIRRP